MVIERCGCRHVLALGVLLAACTTPRQALRVLVVDDQPTWSWRYLRTSLRHEPGITVSACLVGHDVDATRVAFPATAAALAVYDVVIFGDFAFPGDDAAKAEWCRLLAAFVDAGGGVIFECSPGSTRLWNHPAIAELLPVQLASATNANVAGLQLAAGAPIDFAGLRADGSSAATIAALAPIKYMSGVGLRATAELIACDAKQGHPVIASMGFGAGRTIWVGSDETWRWRDPNPDVMVGMWGCLVRFAGAGRR